MAVNGLVLVHPPNVYDFRKRPTLWGPVSDLVPSTSVFDMYPIGFSTITEYLERKGIRVRIVNLAVRMLQDEGFDVEKCIAKLRLQPLELICTGCPMPMVLWKSPGLSKRSTPTVQSSWEACHLPIIMRNS